MVRHIIFACIFFSSCGPSAYFSERITIPETGWTYDNALSVAFDVPDTTGVYDLYLTLDYSEAYSNENLYVKIATVFPNQDTIHDIVSIQLIHDDGYWLGKGSTTLSQETLLQTDFKFLDAGSYTIEIAQHSRETQLEGIKEVGLSLIQK